MSEPPLPTTVFFDADALIAGSASRTGASFLLLQLCELGLLRGVTCETAVSECRRNILKKLPEAMDAFEKLVDVAASVAPEAEASAVSACAGMAHPKDQPILAAAIAAKASYLVTFNTRHFCPDASFGLTVSRPGELIQRIRRILGEFGS